MEVNEYIEQRMERNQRVNFAKPNLQEVGEWIKNIPRIKLLAVALYNE